MDKTITIFALVVVAVAALSFGLTLKGAGRTGSVGSSASTRELPTPPDGAAKPDAAALTKTPSTKGAVSVPEAEVASTAPVPIAATLASSELMTLPQLRDLSTSTPLLALRLAREGNERDPKGPEAPGRAWVIVKSLTNLEHFDEAREEARRMVSAYPNHPDTLDVERHVLLHPSGPAASPRD